MKIKLILFITFISLSLAACGVTEKIEEEASEQIAEKILEQAGGADNVDIEIDGDNASYSVTDEEGNEISVSANNENVKAIVGLGFNIPLPEGVTTEGVQVLQENGEEVTVSGAVEYTNISSADFIMQMHNTLIEQGFTYLDNTNSGATQPDPADPLTSTTILYTHPNGANFTIVNSEEGAFIGLVKGDAQGNANGGTAAAEGSNGNAAPTGPLSADSDTITLDKASYTSGEIIQVTVALNSPIETDAWVGVIPSDIPHGFEADADAADISYAYIYEAPNGQVTISAPYEAGTFDVRLFNTDSNTGVELASVTFTVTE